VIAPSTIAGEYVVVEDESYSGKTHNPLFPFPKTLYVSKDNGKLGFDRRVRAGLDGVLLRRQAERIIAQGVQHVFAEHAVEPGECVGGNVSERVAGRREQCWSKPTTLFTHEQSE